MVKLLDVAPPKTRTGRRTLYRFWEIPEGKGAAFRGTDARKINSALYQFKKTYGGEYMLRSGDEPGTVSVWCLKAPTKAHPAMIEEKYHETIKEALRSDES